MREATHWSDTALKVHLARLVEMEYLLAHRGGRGQSFVYELVYDGGPASTRPHLSGLIDVAQLARDYDAGRSGLAATQSGSGQPTVRGQSGGGQPRQNSNSASTGAASSTIDDAVIQNARPGGSGPSLSYAQPSFLAAAE